MRMAHLHSIYDTDTHFKIDSATRVVKNASVTKTTIAQHDHNSERFTFELPRYIDGHDMSLCNSAQVHYINTDSKTHVQKTGVYLIEDLQPSPDDENVIICSWLISANATKYVGTLSFTIRFACVSDDGKIEYVWSTAKHERVQVIECIFNGDVADEEYVDILSQLAAKSNDLEAQIETKATANIGTITLLAANWEGSESTYSQIVVIDGVTENSQIDLTPTVEQLEVFYEKDLTFVAENDNGVVTVYAIGQKPMNDYTMQVTITEVQV